MYKKIKIILLFIYLILVIISFINYMNKSPYNSKGPPGTRAPPGAGPGSGGPPLVMWRPIEIPITAYIIQDMKLESKGKYINNTIKITNIEKIFKNVNHIFMQADIFWVLTNVIEQKNLDNKKYLTDLGKLQRPEGTETSEEHNKRLLMYRSLINKDSWNKKTCNIYFSTFNGNTRQGKANINYDYIESNGSLGYNWNNTVCNNITMTMIGTNTNKHNDGGIPKKRNMNNHVDGYPSLSFTVVHELAHILGLRHTQTPDIMNSPESISIFTDYQIRILRSTALKFKENELGKC